MPNPLLDHDFLVRLDEVRERDIMAKIILLDLNEMPVEDFSGKVTGGSISLDGTSAIRRTCSLNIVAELDEATSYMWALNSKFKLEIGMKNVLKNEYPQYPDIIWFPQGIYFISSFNINRTTTNTTISIKGKDKMAMLTGDLGGVVPALTWDFGSIEITDETGEVTVEKYLLENIIREAVHEFAKEPFQNIIINDLTDSGLELLQYAYSKPMYLINDVFSGTISQFTLNPDQGPYYLVIKRSDKEYEVFKNEIVKFSDTGFKFDVRNTFSDIEEEPTYFTTDEYKDRTYNNGLRVFTCIKAEEGETIGYRTTDLVYAGDLIANVGESVTSVLDKIKNMLGDYEYFYNLDGQFVFQRKKVSLQHPWNQLSSLNADNNEQYVDLYADQYDYSFDENTIITTLSNTPAIEQVKNDFVVWGAIKDADGNEETPIHCRYAIHVKPTRYKTIDGDVYVTDEQYLLPGDPAVGQGSTVTDWRELIYQMALEYRKHMHDAATPDAEQEFIDELLPQIAANNPEYIDGHTGYEQYYTDMEGFWRTVYNPDYQGTYTPAYNMNSETFHEEVSYGLLYEFRNQAAQPYEPNTYYYKQYSNSENTYILVGKVDAVTYMANRLKYYKPVRLVPQSALYDSSKTYFHFSDDEFYTKQSDGELQWWNKAVATQPEKLIFWIDFIDAKTNSELSKYAVNNIGIRTLAKNDTAVKAIYYREVPNVLFIENTDPEAIAKLKEEAGGGYTILPLNETLTSVFKLSMQGKSAKEEVDSLIYNKACCAETVTFNCLPIYHLEPNSRVYIKDTKGGINGAYLVNRISMNLAHNSTMNVTATKIIDRII